MTSYESRFARERREAEDGMRLCLEADIVDIRIRRFLLDYLGLTSSFERGSRRLRGVLFQVVHSNAECQLPVCAALSGAMELAHNSSLVFDDLQDGHEKRWGRPTLWTLVGRANAENIGLALLLAAQQAFARAGITHVMDFNATVLNIIKGQMADLEAENSAGTDFEVSIDTYMAIAEAKTAAAFVSSAAHAAHAAMTPYAARLRLFAKQLGIAHQIQDDIDDLEQVTVPPGSVGRSNIAWYITQNSEPQREALRIADSLSHESELTIEAMRYSGAPIAMIRDLYELVRFIARRRTHFPLSEAIIERRSTMANPLP